MKEGVDMDSLSKKEKEILAKGEVGLVVRDYDEIFSGFDPRHYSHRALSVDFLDETRRATREVEPGSFELKLLLPMSQRNSEKEEIIKRRLKEHFKKHADMLSGESWVRTRRGIFLTIIGFLMMIFATYLLQTGNKSFGYSILSIIFEPGGWFTLWTGLDLIFAFARERNHELEFYQRMTRANISFSHY
jgi:hypothetical protein